MIIDSFENLAKYFPALPALAEVKKHLADTDEKTANGKYDISDGLFTVVNRYQTVGEGEKPYEVHRQYADLQMILSGRERIIAADTETLIFLSDDFEKGGDNALYEDGGDTPKTSITLTPGIFAIFFPGEAHKPGIDADEKSEVQKVIYKIKV